MTLQCCRCKTWMTDCTVYEEAGVTAGFYKAEWWPDFANPGEVNICDDCMHKDPRYIQAHRGTR